MDFLNTMTSQDTSNLDEPHRGFESMVLHKDGYLSMDSFIDRAQEIVLQDCAYMIGGLEEEFQSLSGKRLLITGGASFLGYYLVQAIVHWNLLQTKSQRVRLTVYDNFAKGVPNWLRRLTDQKMVVLKVRDIRYPLPKNPPDFSYVIHAASIDYPAYYRTHPIETMDSNVNGLRHLLEYVQLKKETGKTFQGMLNFSSCEIYGNPPHENIPTPETYDGSVSCTGPRSCYEESMRYGETLCVNFSRKYEIPVKVARSFNIYGPGCSLHDNGLLPDIAHDVLGGKDILLLSEGTSLRTFCYIADAVIGYYQILVKGHSGEAYNIGVQKPEISVKEFAGRVATSGRELFDYFGQVFTKPTSEGSVVGDLPYRQCPDITKAQKDLGFNPRITLDEGLYRALFWCHYHPDGRELSLAFR